MTPAPGAPHHDDVVAGVVAQLAPVFEGSPQGIYVYLDDAHKACNDRFADMLGYASPQDWDRPTSFTKQYVHPASHGVLVSTYRRAMEQLVASTVDITWVRLDGTPVPTAVMLVPFAFGGELLSLHFVTPY